MSRMLFGMLDLFLTVDSVGYFDERFPSSSIVSFLPKIQTIRRMKMIHSWNSTLGFFYPRPVVGSTGNGMIAMHDDTLIQSEGGKRKPISYGLNSVIVRLEMQVTVRAEVPRHGWGSIFEKAIEFDVLGRQTEHGSLSLFQLP